MTFVINLRKRLLLLLFTFIIGYFVISLVSVFISYKWSMSSTPAMRILTMLQDILVFIMPAMVTAVLVTRQPAELLCVDKRPTGILLVIALCVLVVSMPAMNMVIYLNQNIPLPDSVAASLQAMEENAEAMVRVLQGPHTVPNLIMSLLIVGVFAGFSEELLFRGAFQRLMSTGGVNAHAAIWIAAAVFSLLHLQFYGFIPRMLLGAFFGYSLYWTRSLWIPIVLHATNNSLYLLSQWISDAPEGESVLDQVGHGSDWLIVIISVILTAFGLVLLRRNSLSVR